MAKPSVLDNYKQSWRRAIPAESTEHRLVGH